MGVGSIKKHQSLCAFGGSFAAKNEHHRQRVHESADLKRRELADLRSGSIFKITFEAYGRRNDLQNCFLATQ